MWIQLKNVITDLVTSKLKYEFLVSEDVTLLTAKCGGTTVSFDKSGDTVMVTLENTVVNNQIVGIYDPSDKLIMNVYCSVETPIYRSVNLNTLEYDSLQVNFTSDVIKINVTLNKNIDVDSLTKTVEIDPIISSLTIDNQEEYTRGLNDGLILGQLL